MKRLLLLAPACLVLTAFAFAATLSAEEGVADLQIGDPAPDFSLPGIDDKTHTLADFKDGKVLVIFFTSNHCPTSHGAADRIKSFLDDYRPKGMTFVAINPNHPEGLSIDELGYSKYNDGFEDMKLYAADEGFDFPYLYDGETQAVAKAYGCLATPHVFIFDAERKLRYKGRFDDSRFGGDDSTVKSPDARNAVEALLAGKPVPVEVTKAMGCSTKWRSKKTAVAEKMAKWDATPVEVETIDAAGVAALRKNGSKKVRLINVWATWCAPCVKEFPELVETSRKFGSRDFEFISISADDPSDPAPVKAFLDKQNAGLSSRLKKSVEAEGRKTNSYLYSGADIDGLMKALDPEWPGAIPHTVLIDTDGTILWRHNGLVDGEQLRATILGHLGNYYKR
ncbi:MAG: redoxin domain-containing protein [Verrucomicrobiaceae bacterium]|nr:redoxin domain-containing protein [Verrucomicrobiaceae bacterium]